MISVTELRAGTVFEDRGEYYLVLSYEHIKMGRGSGNVKVKVRNLASGAIIEKSFITGARVSDVSLERKKVQYLYRDAPASAEASADAKAVADRSAGENGFHFMDLESFEQFTIGEKLVSDLVKFLKEGMEILLFMIDDKPMYIEMPKIVDYKVFQTGGTARGNTVGASQKDAQLENGLMVKVPLFIKTGEIIRVDTRSGDYVERAK